MTTEADRAREVREMLQRAAGSVQPASDGLERIEAKLAAARPAARRGPVLVAAAVLAVVALVGFLLARDDHPEVRVATDPTTTVSSTPRTTMSDVVMQTYGIWPWPENDEFEPVDITGPVEVATAYVDDAVGITDATTVSEFLAGDSMSGEVVFGGDVDTTVSVRDLGGGAWNVVAASSDMITFDVRADGGSMYTTGAAGELTSSYDAPRHERVVSGPTRVEPGTTAGVTVFEVGEAPEVTRHRFTLRTDDGVTGLSEIRIEQ